MTTQEETSETILADNHSVILEIRRESNGNSRLLVLVTPNKDNC